MVASEWRERWAEEGSTALLDDLLGVARLWRSETELVAQYGRVRYEATYANCLWEPIRCLGTPADDLSAGEGLMEGQASWCAAPATDWDGRISVSNHDPWNSPPKTPPLVPSCVCWGMFARHRRVDPARPPQGMTRSGATHESLSEEHHG